MSEILQGTVDQLIRKHGGVRPAARVLGTDPSYLCRLRSGSKDNPSASLLRKLGLKKVVTVTFLPLRAAASADRREG